jgi:RsiW-degrading membrane proteinase PrsW (M82 family)
MSLALLLPSLLALVPVLLFLVALQFLDSFKLTQPRWVMAAMLAGALAAGASYLVSGALLARWNIEIGSFSRYVSPVIEEVLKGLLIVALIRSNRIGFLVDAAIFGFAVGSGFAVVENIHFLLLAPDASMATWIVRGFGTAIMHGGTTAIFAVMGLAMLERSSDGGDNLRGLLPGLALAVLLHSAFNHLSRAPQWATLAVMIALPALLAAVFQRSEAATRDWLGTGFDTDVQMLELINAGGIADTAVGRYLHTLRDRFAGPLLADVLCYVRLYTELSLRAKGLLMMLENGFAAELSEEARASVAELRYLEASIGKTGLRAVRPLLRMNHKELWQIYMIKAS